jgi:PST family polysaccharide transporter
MQRMGRSSLRTQATKGAMLTGVAQIYRMAVNFIASIILARLLTPGDFGVVAIASSSMALVVLVQDLGLSQTTIQRQAMSLRQLSGLFWISAGSGLLFAVVLTLLAPGVALLFGDERLTSLVAVFAMTVAVGGFQSQLLALMNRQFRFKALAAIDMTATTTGVIAGLTTAWLTPSYWALVAPYIAASITSLTCVSIFGQFRPSSPSFEGDFRQIFKFSSGVSGYNIANYLARNADNFLIGKFYGDEQLGYYDRAYRLLLFPLLQILAPLSRVMLPVLSRLRSDPYRYRNAYGECVSLVMTATQPGIVFAVIFADEFFRVLLGPQWVPAAPIFQWLGLCGLHQVMTSTLAWLLTSQERTSDLFKIGLCNALISITAFLAGLPWGGLGVAIAYTASNYAALVPITWWSVGRRGPVSTADLCSIALPHAAGVIVCSGIMVGIYSSVGSLNVLTSIAIATLSYAAYLLTLLAFPRKRQIAAQTLRIASAKGFSLSNSR